MDGETGIKNEQPVTITAPPAQVTVDPQNPLPEPSFFWRRVLTIIITVATLLMTWHNLEALHDLKDSRDLLTLSKWLLALDAMALTYYFIAPSAAELTAMIQSAKIIRGGMTLAASPQTAAQGDSSPQTPLPPPDPLGRAVAPVSGDQGGDDDEDFAPKGRS
ncbi:MAG TPA: hypothetical protein VK181_06660 [Rhizobium sp.]|nr:hypothetical protein [Rhizobium sp.]